MRVFRSPRLWLFAWGGLGALLVLYVIIAASVQPGGGRAVGAGARDRSLLVGEMADFEYAFPPRGAPQAPFLHEGREMTLADFRGKVVLVNFWATWCAPCLKELPSLDALQGRLGGEAFEVAAIAADPRGPEAAREFLDRLGIERLKLYADPRLRLAASIGGGAVLPVSILYDREGNEVGRLVGEADWDSPEARRLIRSVIDAG
ncbi:TlpA family protein disulfide reductase [Amphiplicatus metriothermophilus]|uniref:Thiol-disulfide isomerase or thioredoxin n=1 Tax=Amphiplicatus metriothermophilus TaxID=1519374 RepID=A0A239PMS3_9PROT|nr:TlpA disulfide reductase family protein [Amphiplicatus metriothermophilus]MBB5517230.1 thiol-disulfide isomerase/thioredoxin [Amphiplicatus metriothermophilus]SNT68434.1 Thiol-disulfide isomerase or thioredoxin [Amphiplicatus metriothermophilus]